MGYFGVEYTPELSERIAVFKNGTANCTRGYPDYQNSIQKFMEEWGTAERYSRLPSECKKDYSKIPEAWALYLKTVGIEIVRQKGVIEKKESLIKELNQHKLVICDVAIPSEYDTSKPSRHAVMILFLNGNNLFIFDPLGTRCDSEYYKSIIDEHTGANLKVNADYFFGCEEGIFKPQLNLGGCITGYSFLVISRNQETTDSMRKS
jgi:hypothetical protein